MSIEVDPPKPRSGVWKWVLLAGCALLLLAGGTCAGLVALGYGVYRQSVIQDPPRVAALAGEILPGAAPPPGYAAVLGSDVAGFKMALFMPPERAGEHSTMGVFLLPMTPKDMDLDRALEDIRKGQGDQGVETVLSAGVGSRSLGGRDVPTLRQLTEETAGRKVREIAMLGNPQGHVVMILLEGPEGRLDEKAFATFGQGVRLEGFQVLGTAPGSGRPASPGAAEAEPRPGAGSASPAPSARP